ncbi:MAG: molybdopterin-dependent oxidoreductase [Myxococcota bacterium]
MESDGGRHEVPTFCRVCEPACGLVATVGEGELQGLRPDREHPVTRGFACHKGLASIDIHRDPDRLGYPERRREDGRFEKLSWDEAVDEIAGRLKGLLSRYGPEAVGSYIGNPSAFNALLGAAASGFFRTLGVRRGFSSGTQDCANKFAGSEAVFGSSTIHPVPDLDHCDHLLIFGENPRVSHMSFLAIADPMRVLKDARRRGATIRFVNPRRIESAGPEVGDVVQIRPDTDVYLLAAMLAEIDATVGFDAEVVAAHATRIEALRSFVRRYPADRVAPVVGLAASEIRGLAAEFARAERAAVHMSTGVNMGRQGTLAYWLLHMLSFVTGNLDRRGGNLKSDGFYPNSRAGRGGPDDAFRESPFGPLRRGTLPANLLAQYIEEHPQPLRALIVVAGNPLLSVAGEPALRRAFSKLELLVTIDLYRTATGELAHFNLPATDWLERADLNIAGLGLQHRPWVQLGEPVVPPRDERREEWWIFARLAQAMGQRSALDAADPEALVWQRMEHMLARSRLSLADLKRDARGVVLPRSEPGRFYDEVIQTEDGRVDCCPPGFSGALERCEEIFEQLRAEGPEVLKLITLRTPYMHNTWYQNLPRLKRGLHDRNWLHMNPEDARSRGFADAARVSVKSAHGEVETQIRLDESLRPGVVAMTHGWGNARTSGMQVAQRHPGANANILLPAGPGSFEPLSSQAHMTGIRVEVAPA